MFNVGQVCTKIAGKEAGRECIVVEEVDSNYVMVTGPSVKRRRCSVRHLMPLPQVLLLKKGASDVEAADALIKAGIVEKVKVPHLAKDKKTAPQPQESPKVEEEKPKRKLLSRKKKE